MIQSGDPIDLQNVSISGHLDLSHLSGPVEQSVRITNSRFLDDVFLEGVTFQGPVDLRQTAFQG